MSKVVQVIKSCTTLKQYQTAYKMYNNVNEQFELTTSEKDILLDELKIKKENLNFN